MKISAIIPCYNEGAKLAQNITKVNDYLKTLKYDYEIIISNDGSTDDTSQIVNRLKSLIPNIIFVDEKINRGKGRAVKNGMSVASGDYLFFMDADLSTDLKAVENGLKLLESYDIVIGSRKLNDTRIPEEQPLLRKFIGKAGSITINAIIPLKIEDTQCGFKGFRKEVAEAIFPKQQIDGFAFDVELLYISSLLGYSIKEMPVIWINDADSRVRVVRDSIRFVCSLAKIRAHKNYYLSREVAV